MSSSLNSTTKRRNRASNNNINRNVKLSNIAKVNNGPIIKGKGRQSVSTDSGVMSDESQSSSPTSLLNNTIPQHQLIVDRHGLMRPTTQQQTTSAEALATFAKNKLLGDLLANQFNILEPATSSRNFTNPLAGKLTTLSHFLGNAGFPESSLLNDLLLNLSPLTSNLGLPNNNNNAELQRLQLLQLYNYQKQQQQQQNILQQLLLGNSDQILLAQLLQQQEHNNPLNEQNSALLAQLLLSKLTPEQKKFNDYLSSEQKTSSLEGTGSSSSSQQPKTNNKFLEEYVLTNNVSTKMEVDSHETNKNATNSTLQKTESDSSMLVV